MVFGNVKKTAQSLSSHFIIRKPTFCVSCVNNALDNDDDDDNCGNVAFPIFPFALLQSREAAYVRTYETRM